MTDPNGSEKHAFVIRLWRDQTTDRENLKLWRGTIDHIGSGNRHYFSELEGLVEFIRRMINQGTDQGESWWRAIVRLGQRLIEPPS